MTAKTTKGRNAHEKTTAQTARKTGADSRKGVEQDAARMQEGLEAATAFNQANVEAIVASSALAAKAFEAMTSEIAAYSKKSYEDGMVAAKELSSCRNVAELFEKQAAFQRSAIENLVAEATRLNELYAAAAKDAFEPLGKRFTAAVDVVKDYRL